jgi:hypothetical protein
MPKDEKRDEKTSGSEGGVPLAGVGLILGVAAGFAMGGPLGAAIGGGVGLVLGAAVDASRKKGDPS